MVIGEKTLPGSSSSTSSSRRLLTTSTSGLNVNTGTSILTSMENRPPPADDGDDEAEAADGGSLDLLSGSAPQPAELAHKYQKLKRIPLFFKREIGKVTEPPKVMKWRMKDRMKTVSGALVLCLNIGVDPPDVIKTSPCARLECWFDPFSSPPQKAIDTIGKTLQANYERWQGKARYKQCLDPTVEEVKKLCTTLRRAAKDDRVLFHYNGHGVPRPTANGEIWVFNKNFTQYIPLSILELQGWLTSPSIYVFDCSSSGAIINWFLQFAQQREKDHERALASNPLATVPVLQLKDCILLAACGVNEILPMNPDLPADLFTSCLLTPIRIALRWFHALNKQLMEKVTPEMLDRIPGKLTDRRTPLGELNWVFTAVTDTIAWTVLPPDLFQKLFRQDLLVASLFRNFLLAERVMRSVNCTPVSFPKLPSTHQHPMWQAWDLTLDICLAQLPDLNMDDPNAEFKHHSPFFAEQLTAFEVWLEFGAESKKPPEQLPIVLQVLLSQSHRLRALVLLARFLDLGPWAVNQALSVGIFPYVLKLLQSSAIELRQVLVAIWTRILALDKTCQIDLIKDNGHSYFINVLLAPKVPADQRTMSAFILSVILSGCTQAQTACLPTNLLPACLAHIRDTDPLLRRWVVLCLAKFWEGFEDGKARAIKEGAHEQLLPLLTDPMPEVRAATLYAFGLLFHGSTVDVHIGMSLPVPSSDASPIVRKELIIALAHLISCYEDQFTEVAQELMHSEMVQRREEERKKAVAISMAKKKKEGFTGRSPPAGFVQDSPPSTAAILSAQMAPPSSPSGPSAPPTPQGTPGGGTASLSQSQSGMNRLHSGVFSGLWRLVNTLASDPMPELSRLAFTILDRINSKISARLMAVVNNNNLADNSAATQLAAQLGLLQLSGAAASATAGGGGSFRGTSTRTSLTDPSYMNRLGLTSSSSNLANISNMPSIGQVSKSLTNVPTLRTSVTSTPQGPPPPTTPGRPTELVSSGSIPVPSGGSASDIKEEAPFPPVSTFYDCNCIFFKSSCSESNSRMVFGERLWVRQRNKAIIKEALSRRNPVIRKFEDQVAIFGNDNETAFGNDNNAASLVIFHPFEPLIIVGDDRDYIKVWNWEESSRVTAWRNGNPTGTRLTGLTLANEHENAIMLVASDDGIVRAWKGFGRASESPQLAASFRAFNDFQTRARAAGLTFDWQQFRGLLATSGDVPAIRMWDIEKELVVQDIPTNSEACVTSLTNDKNFSNLIVAGFGDGSVRVFDYRVPSGYSLALTLVEHNNWVINVAVPRFEFKIISGSVSGEVKFWDVRTASSSKTIPHSSQMTALAVHDWAPVIASGSQQQKIKVSNFAGEEISLIRYHDGFLGQRIGPVSALSFHPYRLNLAAGATDSIVSIYESAS